MKRSATVKARNEALLQRLGFVVNTALPEIEPLQELEPRTPRAVAERAIVLANIAATGYGRPPADSLRDLERIGLMSSLTRIERDHFRKRDYSDAERGWAQWLIEAVNACSWCLEKTHDLAPLSLPSDELHEIFILCPDPQKFISTARLRDLAEIHEYADLYYRAHWAARDARLAGEPCPLVESVPFMRRWALDWVVGLPYEWDDIPHDT